MIKQSQKTRKVTIIAAFRKPSGTIKAQVKNDEDLSYFVTVSKHGTMCRRWDGRECTGHHFTGHCYHVDAVREISDQIGAEGIVEPAPQDCKTVQSVTRFLRDTNQHAYEQLAMDKGTVDMRAHLAKDEKSNREACRHDSITAEMQARNDAERRANAQLNGNRSFASVLLNK